MRDLYRIYLELKEENYFFEYGSSAINSPFWLRDESVGTDLMRYKITYTNIAKGTITDAIATRENYSNIGFFYLYMYCRI